MKRGKKTGAHLEGQEGEGGTRDGEDVVRVGGGEVLDPAESFGVETLDAATAQSAEGKEHGHEDCGLGDGEDEIGDRVDVVLAHQLLHFELGHLLPVHVTGFLGLFRARHPFDHVRLDGGHPRGVLLRADEEREQEEAQAEGDDGDEDGPLETGRAEEGERLVQVQEEGFEAHDGVRAPRALERAEVERAGRDPVVDVLHCGGGGGGGRWLRRRGDCLYRFGCRQGQRCW